MSGTELLRIADMREMEVNALVNENDIVRVHTGDTSTIEVEAFSGRIFKGVVTEIARSSSATGVSASANTGDKVVNFLVKIRITRASYQDLIDSSRLDFSPFFPGMNATVDIRTRMVTNEISVPIMAVTIRSTAADSSSGGVQKKTDDSFNSLNDGKEVVFLYENGKVKQQEVKTGIQDNNYIRIISGLSVGQEVVSGPYSAVSRMLNDGMEVERKSAAK